MTSRIVTLTIAAVACVGLSTAEAQGHARGHAPGRVGGGGVYTGRAMPRGGRPIGVAPRIISPRIYGIGPYRPYYYPYRPGLTFGFYAGLGYGYPYPYG